MKDDVRACVRAAPGSPGPPRGPYAWECGGPQPQDSLPAREGVRPSFPRTQSRRLSRTARGDRRGDSFLPTGASLPLSKPFRSLGAGSQARPVGRGGIRLWVDWPVRPACALSPTLGLGCVPTPLLMGNEYIFLSTDSRSVYGR